jgi:hypothetical protein
MFGKFGPFLPNIGKGRSTLCFAAPPLRVAPLPPSGVFANVWQISMDFAEHWQNAGIARLDGAPAKKAPQSKALRGPHLASWFFAAPPFQCPPEAGFNGLQCSIVSAFAFINGPPGGRSPPLRTSRTSREILCFLSFCFPPE